MGMSDKKLNQVLDIYEKCISNFDPSGLMLITPGIEDATQRDAAQAAIKRLKSQIDHVKEMIGKIRVFLTEGRREKAFRWLGFIQGVFYSLGVYTIEQMADHNRPTKGDLEEQYPGHSFGENDCPSCGWGVDSRVTCKFSKEYMDAPNDIAPTN